MWEDAANAQGGKWVLTMKNNPALLDRCWAWLAMALVGEELEEGDEICGAVVSLRSKVDRIQLWTRSKDDVERLNGIGKKLVKLLDVSEADGIGLEFQVRHLAFRLVQLFIPLVYPVQHGGSTFAEQVPVHSSDAIYILSVNVWCVGQSYPQQGFLWKRYQPYERGHDTPEYCKRWRLRKFWDWQHWWDWKEDKTNMKQVGREVAFVASVT